MRPGLGAEGGRSPCCRGATVLPRNQSWDRGKVATHDCRGLVGLGLTSGTIATRSVVRRRSSNGGPQSRLASFDRPGREMGLRLGWPRDIYAPPIGPDPFRRHVNDAVAVAVEVGPFHMVQGRNKFLHQR